jgi:hypothetical protein
MEDIQEMLLPGAEVKVEFRYEYLGQRCENVQSYICQGAIFTTVGMVQFLEALWNNYKDRLRAVAPANPDVFHFTSLNGTQVGGSLEFGEFPIPDAERLGLRGADDDDTWITGINAWGFRQTVATRFTRPGQKRFPFLVRSDVDGNVLAGGFDALKVAVATAFCSPSTLGAPALAGVAQPIIVHEPGTRDPVRHVQDVTGFVGNENVTSQVSRKAGHGA